MVGWCLGVMCCVVPDARLMVVFGCAAAQVRAAPKIDFVSMLHYDGPVQVGIYNKGSGVLHVSSIEQVGRDL